MILATKYFGELECAEDALIDFPEGIPGFEHARQFVCLEQPIARPIVYLQSVTEPDLCFLTMPARSLETSYEVQLSTEEAERLHLNPGSAKIGEDVACMAIVSAEPGTDATANLFAPVVINIRNRIGLQVIQSHSQYDFRHPIASCAEEVAC
jgi:flagellar assembly factor FliW